MEVGYCLTVGWQMLSFFIVIGSLTGIGYVIWDAHRESEELAELEIQREEAKRTIYSHAFGSH
jgi:hypothetical protein